MSIITRVLAPAAGQERCHFLVPWRDGHAIRHGRTFTICAEAAEFDAVIKAEKLPRDAPSYASLLGDAGLPDHDIQRRLGHAHPGEVRWYRHPYPTRATARPPATPSTPPSTQRNPAQGE